MWGWSMLSGLTLCSHARRWCFLLRECLILFGSNVIFKFNWIQELQTAELSKSKQFLHHLWITCHRILWNKNPSDEGNSGEQLKCFKSRSGFIYILRRICGGYQVFVDFFAWLLSLNNRIFDFRSLLQRQNCDRFGQKIKSWLCMSQNVKITALCETRDQETLQHWVSMMTKFGISNTREECIQLNKELSLSRSMSSSMVTWWIWWVQIVSKYLQFNVTKLGWHCTCHIGWDKRQECLGWQWVMKQLSSRQY